MSSDTSADGSEDRFEPHAEEEKDEARSANSKDEGRFEHPIASAITTYLEQIRAVEAAAMIYIPTASEVLQDAVQDYREAIEDATEMMESDNPETQILGSRKLIEANREHKKRSLRGTPQVVERALFLSLFAYFDAYMGRLVEAIYKKRPELFNQLDKSYTVPELLEYSTLEDLKEVVLHEEIESLRRKSYRDQFSLLENRFGLTLTDFERWPDFVECAQRRNLLTHADGMVSEQYLTVCNEVEYEFEETPELGEQLGIGADYFVNTCKLLQEVGLKLGQVLWRKVFRDEIEKADSHLHNEHYETLEREEWHRAAVIGDFFLSLPRHSKELYRRLAIVNHAIALRSAGRVEESKKLVEDEDWSAASPDFKLARAVLLEDWEEAQEWMQTIGQEGSHLDEQGYHTWPLFEDFRDTPEFRETYEEIYGYEFIEEQKEEAEKRSASLREKEKEGGEAVADD